MISADQNFAYLFDPESGKLYKQIIASEGVTKSTFGNGYALLHSQKIAPAGELAPQEKFKAAWKKETSSSS